MKELSLRLALAAVGVLVAASLPTAAASADDVHHHTFTQSAEYFDATDRNGRFTAQANMHAGYTIPMPWSFRISPQIQAIATSNMNCTAGHHQLPYSDSHPSVPVDYHWHSTVQGNQVDNTKYDLWGNCTFRVQVGGNPGTANLRFQFHYSMFCAPCGRLTARELEEGFSTELEIMRDDTQRTTVA